MIKPQLVYIRWTDAVQEEAASPHTGVTLGLAELHTAGFLIAEDDQAVLVGMELEPDGCSPGRWRIHIPRSSIKELRLIPLRARARKKSALNG